MNSTGKISHTLVVALVAVFALLVFASVARGADEQCIDISGLGTQVLVNGQPNSGVIDFETQVPGAMYEACLEDLGDDGIGPFLMKGWAWNTNLGWVSFYCGDENEDGPPYENLGVSCGNVLYGVTMAGPGPSAGRLSGYAWGDNMGWMSVNCNDLGACGGFTYYVEAETTDEDCLGNVYTSDGSCTTTPNRPLASVYAWTDTVGWMSFNGVEFPWGALVQVEEEPLNNVDIDIDAVTPDGTGSGSGNRNDAPYANDDDVHKLVIRLTEDGLPLENPQDYTLTIELDWIDTVDLNQIDSTNGDYSACTAPCAGGAVTKPGTASFNMANYGADPEYPDALVAEITSKAPTSNMNGLDEGGDGSIDFSFETFVLGDPHGGVAVPQNELVLEDIRIALENPVGECSFGAMGCATAPALDAPISFSFRPVVDITQLDDQINGYFISAQNTVANALDSNVFCEGTLNCASAAFVDFYSGVDGDFAYVYDVNGDGADVNDPEAFDSADIGSFAFDAPFTFELTPVCDAEGGECPSGASNAYVYSVARYILGGQLVQHFSNKLPRVQGTLVVNPVASIRGNVYSTGVTNPQTGEEVRSIGELSTNILRDALFRNVSNILAGAPRPSGNATVTGWDGVPGGGFEVTGGVTRLLNDITSIPKAYYFTGDVTIDAGATLSWNGERTLIIEGGNLYIQSNLYNTGIAISRPKLGIIVLKNLATGAGGNVYIAPDVGNLQMNLYADGSLFTYHPENGLTATGGLPRFDTETDRFNRLKNQLYIQGSLATQNTIGGASATPPIRGDGGILSATEGGYGDVPTGRSAARLYDLNFLRYYGLVFERDPVTGNAIDKDGDGVLEATPYIEGNDPGINGDLVPIPDGLPAQGVDEFPEDQRFSAVYVFFDPPPSTLPGFGTTAGVNVRLLP